MNWLLQDKKYIWHPFTQQKTEDEPIFIDHGEGSWLIDHAGNRYLDAISSWWVNIHGHGNPYIAKKIYEQALKLEHIIFAGFTHQPAVELAANLVPLLPGQFSKLFYSDNGSTSTEVALKMAIQYWWNKGIKGRRKILAFTNSYHGDTFGAMSVSDRSVFTLAFQDHFFEVVFIDTPTLENLAQLKRIIAAEGDHIAAFIFEPLVQGAGGMHMYPAELLDELLIAVRLQDIICIADEVMTGFGRTGMLFACDYLKEKPDIICLSKGLTGGVMALGVTACTEKIHAAYFSDDKTKTFFHGHSFTANPLACTAALSSLELLKDGALANMEQLCAWNTSFKTSLINRFSKEGSIIRNIRQLGTILAFEINIGEDKYLNQIGQVITKLALSENVYLRPLGNTVYIMPPYCLSEHEYQILASATIKVIEQV